MSEVRAANKSGIAPGTTTSAYVEALRVDTRGYGIAGKLLLIINNTQAAQTMKYKIDGYPSDVDGTLSGKFIAIKAETSIAAATQVAQVDVDKGYAAVVVSVINDSGACTYRIDWTTY
jgi:hypothetical protein